MTDSRHRPILILLTSHWVAMAGVTLVTLAGFSWLFLLPLDIQGHAGNAYIGLLVFIAIPAVFFAGLALIPIGIALGRRRVVEGLDSAEERKTAWRRAGIFFAVMTFANLIIGSQATYRAVAHMETVQFCGQTCHVMKPEFTGHLRAPHQQVECASCHVSPGATGWIKAKMSGTRQLVGVALNSFPRPIESALESNRLVSSADTCEQCHARGRVIGPRLKRFTKFGDDEANTRTETVLMMRVGGGDSGGIHGVHMGPGVHMRYAAADKKRQTIAWVEYRNEQNGVTRNYAAAGTNGPGSLPVFEMQCVDCHNRAAHAFEVAEHAVDESLANGAMAANLPFVKKTGVGLIQAVYSSDTDAATKIPAALTAFYRDKYPEVYASRSSEVQQAGDALVRIYSRNVFPDLKVTWGTYPNNLGHNDYTGCFRCHDDAHATSDKKTITQDCNTCHEMLATDEASPKVLQTLGLVPGTK